MGVSCAPPYAIIVMFGLESQALTNFKSVLYYKRFIDDVFFVVPRGHADDFRTLLINSTGLEMVTVWILWI